MLSIVTINRNNIEGLSRTIESLRSQSSQDFEWICVDGLSTDDSFQLALTFKRSSDVLISELDSGIYSAMNKGLSLASQNMVLFLNSGDIFYDRLAIERLLPLCTEKLDFAMFGFKIRDVLRAPRALWWRFWSMPTSHQAILYSRELLLRFPFNEEYRLAADYDQFLRMNRQNLHFVSSASPLIVNEPYGTDENLGKVISEYRHSLISNGYPSWWANLLYWAKSRYLPIVLVK